MSQPPPQQPMQPYGYPEGYPPPGYAPPGYSPPGYAPQYAFWPHYDAAPDVLLAPARRAGWLLIGMGVIALLMGTCVGAVFGAIAPPQLAQMLGEIQKQQAANAAALAVTPQQLRAVMIGMGVAIGVVGVLAIGLGALVRGGGRVWLVLAMIACSLAMLYFAFVMLTSLFAGAASVLGSLILLALPMAATVMTMMSMAQALRNASRIDAARQQAAYAAYYGAPPSPPPPV